METNCSFKSPLLFLLRAVRKDRINHKGLTKKDRANNDEKRINIKMKAIYCLKKLFLEYFKVSRDYARAYTYIAKALCELRT